MLKAGGRVVERYVLDTPAVHQSAKRRGRGVGLKRDTRPSCLLGIW